MGRQPATNQRQSCRRRSSKTFISLQLNCCCCCSPKREGSKEASPSRERKKSFIVAADFDCIRVSCRFSLQKIWASISFAIRASLLICWLILETRSVIWTLAVDKNQGAPITEPPIRHPDCNPKISWFRYARQLSAEQRQIHARFILWLLCQSGFFIYVPKVDQCPERCGF